MGKFLWAAVVVLVLIIGGGAWWLYRSLDQVVASAIRSYGPEITGVSVKLERFNIKPAEGMAALVGLELGNPKGFKTPRALAVGTISMQLDVASLTKDVVLIKEIVIEKPEVTYEYASGGSNLDVIQRNVEAYVASKTGKNESTPKDNATQKKVIIEQVVIRDARAAVSAEILQGKAMTLVLPDMRLTDIGKKAGGVTPAEATRQVVGAISQSATKAVAPLNLGGAMDSIKKGVSSATDTVKGWFK
ncbi:MAG: hypothetical protein KGN32_10050 [Burkholderiales bacterium]|nr:hypothetical protein [Burkholderiales bacterium]